MASYGVPAASHPAESIISRDASHNQQLLHNIIVDPSAHINEWHFLLVMKRDHADLYSVPSVNLGIRT